MSKFLTKKFIAEHLKKGGFKHEVQHGITTGETPLQAS
jgi:hypothetical protein